MPVSDNLLDSRAGCRVVPSRGCPRSLELARIGLQSGVVGILDSHTEGVAGEFAQPRNGEAEACGGLLGSMVCLPVARRRKSDTAQLPTGIEDQRAEHFAVFAYLEGVGVCQTVCPPNKGRLVARRRYRNIFVGCL